MAESIAMRPARTVSDPNFRRRWIARIYHQPGRPLKADDFPGEFREKPEARKKAILQSLSARY